MDSTVQLEAGKFIPPKGSAFTWFISQTQTYYWIWVFSQIEENSVDFNAEMYYWSAMLEQNPSGFSSLISLADKKNW